MTSYRVMIAGLCSAENLSEEKIPQVSERVEKLGLPVLSSSVIVLERLPGSQQLQLRTGVVRGAMRVARWLG